MKRKLKTLLISLMAVVIMLPIGSTFAMSEGNDDSENIDTTQETGEENTETTPDEGDKEDEEEVTGPITDEQALAMCEFAAENDAFKMYYDAENERVAVVVKETGVVYWSSPINADADASITDKLKENLKSTLILKYGDVSQRRESGYQYSFKENGKKKDQITYEVLSNGLKVTYTYKVGFVIPVYFTLEEDSWKVTCDTSQIDEENISTLDGKVLTKIQLCPQFGATEPDEEGYIFVPDGSGAIIELNNGRYTYPEYSLKLYGRDLTPVPLIAPAVTEQSYMPVVAMVSGNNGLVAIATGGDTNATVKANVSYQKDSMYNSVYFEFEVRSIDKFYLNGGGTEFNVFERGNIKVPKLEVTYYAIQSEEDIVPYTDIADTYRNYLIKEKGLTKKNPSSTSPLYVDIYGGVLKERSIVGIPFTLKTSITSYDETVKIVEKLKNAGIEDFVLNYNDWTDKDIGGKIADVAKPSGTLGGKSDFNDMVKYFANNNVNFFVSFENMTFSKNSWGYFASSSTAIRISNAQSRQSAFHKAFGTPLSGVAPSLLAPKKYDKLFASLISSLASNNLNGAFGSFSSTLVSDYSKKGTYNRYDTMNTIVENYKKASEKLDAIYASAPNAYLLPYVDYVSNLPLSSSGFNVVNYDIPFYQMVIRGYVSYSTKPINASADSDTLYLLALASGSALHYDFIYEDVSVLMDTEYDRFFYANYNGWIETAAQQQKLAKIVLDKIGDSAITGYVMDNGLITTTYSNGVVTVVDMNNATVKVDNTTYKVSDYVKGGLDA